MSVYKVIQDIEAEDKLLGPFSLRQFIYLIIVAVSLFIGYRLAIVQWFLALPLLPHTVFFGLLAAPFGRDQPSEVWLLAKVRFYLKPRRRIWDQSGIKELVTITAPKRVEKTLTKDLTQSEVTSRLQALADTIDSRGWAIKNVNVNLFAQPAMATGLGTSDRLLDVSDVAQQVPADDVGAHDDILDEQNNPTAQNLDRMIHASSRARRDQLVAQMKQATQAPSPPGPPANTPGGGPPTQMPQPGSTPPRPSPPAPQSDYWFLNATGGTPTPPAPGLSTFSKSNIVTPDPSVAPAHPAPAAKSAAGALSEQELLDKIHAEKEKPKNYGHLRVIKPIEEQRAEAAAAAARASTVPPPPEPPVTAAPDPAIMQLANNDDLNVATIAHEANKHANKDKQEPTDEVVISLH